MPHLHHDIWFEILSWLSASYLYNIVSRVCHTWATIIHNPYFVDMHLSRSRTGLFIQDIIKHTPPPHTLELIDGFAIGSLITSNNFPGLMHSSYQGVSLFCYSDRGTFYVINPVTMQFAQLSRPNVNQAKIIRYSYSIIRDRRSRELKVVCACLQSQCAFTWYVQRLGIENTWKNIGEWKSGRGILTCPGMSIGYFMVYVVASVRIVVLDVSDESIRPIHCPVPIVDYTRLPCFVQMGNELSCISHDSGKILIHVLKDFLAGNWSLYLTLDYGCIHGEPLENHRFLGWLGNCDELLVRLCKLCKLHKFGSCADIDPLIYTTVDTHEWKYFTYNIKAKRITYLDRSVSKTDEVLVHTNSLLSWKTLQP